MTKSMISITIDTEIIEEAKKMGLNISKTCNEALKTAISYTEDPDRLKESYDSLYNIIQDASKILEKLNIMYKEAIAKRDKQRQDLDNIPELQNLKIEDLRNNEFLLNLISVIRAKYNIRIGIRQIQEYYKVI